jgi:hypothetical protein
MPNKTTRQLDFRTCLFWHALIERLKACGGRSEPRLTQVDLMNKNEIGETQRCRTMRA